MTDGGVSVRDSSAHVATPQWQSFEMRMRRRRAERCAARAQREIDSGRLDEAAASLEEARQLAPLDPTVEELGQRLEALRAATRSARRGSQAWAIVAGLLLALAGVLGWLAARHQAAPLEAGRQRHADVALRVEPPAPVGSGVKSGAVTGLEVAAPTPPAKQLSREVEAEPIPEPPRPSPRTEQRNRTVAPTVTAAREPAAPPRVAAGADLPPVRESAAMKPPPPVDDELSERLVPPATGLPERPAAAAPPAARSADASLTPARPRPVPDPRAAIRATLDRYAAAYSELNVAAVRAVWPAIDQRALSRAFDGLVSQRVSLGSCSVDVAGAIAHARCSGTAEWAPKVGGGQRSAARSWAFDLGQSNGSWQIVRVDTR